MRSALWPGLLLLLVAACGSSQVGEDDPRSGAGSGSPAFAGSEAHASGPAIVRGTTIEASSGQPLAGVLVQGPGGAQATSDGEGRFELEGLPLGTPGELLATTEDGRSGRNRLRPLRAGTLEVVIFVR